MNCKFFKRKAPETPEPRDARQEPPRAEGTARTVLQRHFPGPPDVTDRVMGMVLGVGEEIRRKDILTHGQAQEPVFRSYTKLNFY